jgi:hypothetical protein
LTRIRFRQPPVRSPLLRGYFLFLGVHEMFQFPRCPPLVRAVTTNRWLGCPIRKSRDHSPLAAPPRLSQQCHVLLRHAAPRHPPSAHTVFPEGRPENDDDNDARSQSGTTVNRRADKKTRTYALGKVQTEGKRNKVKGKRPAIQRDFFLLPFSFYLLAGAFTPET